MRRCKSACLRLCIASLAGALCTIAPRAALSACCELVKVDADPPVVQVRACDPAASSGCTSWLFDGSLTEGQSAPVCASEGLLVYQEFDTATQTYGAPVDARCEEGGRVEL